MVDYAQSMIESSNEVDQRLLNIYRIRKAQQLKIDLGSSDSMHTDLTRIKRRHLQINQDNPMLPGQPSSRRNLVGFQNLSSRSSDDEINDRQGLF